MKDYELYLLIKSFWNFLKENKRKSVKYLWYNVAGDDLYVNTDKIKAILDYKNLSTEAKLE